MDDVEKRRKEAQKWELISAEDRARPRLKFAIGVTASGEWIWGDENTPIVKKRKERADKGKPRK